MNSMNSTTTKVSAAGGSTVTPRAQAANTGGTSGQAESSRALLDPALECVDQEQVPTHLQAKATDEGNRPGALLLYLLLGVYLGVLFVQSEVVSWFRIQEMFRFQSFHMYGIIGSAVAVAALSLQIIRWMDLKTIHGEPIRLEPKEWGGSGIPGARYWIGGTLFGMGWALVGACPGPMFALVGTGMTTLVVALLAAMLGTWTYAVVRGYLPH